MLIAAVQSDVRIGDLAANRGTVVEHLAKLADRGVDLAVFTECMMTGYAFDSREAAMATAPAVDDPVWADLAEEAGRRSIAFSVGTLLRDGDRLTNSSLLIDGTGVLARYDKIHLPHLGVDRFVDRGKTPYQVTELANGCRVGLAICYDSSFPEPMRELALAGADVIALGTNWPVAASRTAAVVPPARSMENHLFFVAANRVGQENGFRFCGLSSICGPDGVVLAHSSDDQAAVLIAEIDVAQSRNKRIQRTAGAHVIDRFADRQPAFYGRIGMPTIDAPHPDDFAD